MNVESLAVSTVNSVLGTADYLKSYINEGEKGPCLDGYICTYSKKGYRKANESGRAPVQVKGKEASAAELLSERISYPVDLSDLLTYRREGGAIFFVVLIDKDKPENRRIYYNPLLPYDLNEIINGKENQGSVTIHLRPFPAGKAMEDAVLSFAHNRIKQFGIVRSQEYRNYGFEEIVKKQGVNAPYSFNIGYTTVEKVDDERPFSYFFNHDFYIYCNTDPFGNMIPTQHVSHMEMVSTNVVCSLKIGDTEFFNHCFIYFLKDRTVYGFKRTDGSAKDPIPKTTVAIQNMSEGEGMTKPLSKKALENIDDEKFPFVAVVYVDKDEQGRQKVIYTYKIFGSLNDRINTEAFLLTLIEEQEYSINGNVSEVHPSAEELQKFKIDVIRDDYDNLLKAKEALDRVGCRRDLAYSEMSEGDKWKLRCLVASVLDGTAIGFQSEIPEIAVYDIANLHLLLLFERQEDGKYLIRPFPSEIVECHIEDDEGIHPTSFYTAFDDKDYERISNFDMAKVAESICSYEDAAHYDRANLSLLEMLSAYDRNADEQLLEAAQKIAEWLVTRENTDVIISKINLYQCLKRKGKLTEEIRKEIRNLIRSNKINPECMAGCYLLLDKSEKAAGCIEKLPPEKKDAFLTFPIMKFMSQDKRRELDA